MKKLLALVVAFLLVFLCACGETGASSAAQTEESETQVAEDNASSPEKKESEEPEKTEESEEPEMPEEGSEEEPEKMAEPETGKSATVPAGKYVGGRDIPVGQYICTRSEGKTGSGIVWLSAPDDNLEEEYPSLIYEFVSKEDEASFFISLQEGGTLCLPFECKLTSVNISQINIGESIPASAGTYIGGLDLPAGQYLLSYGSEHTGSGIIWLSSPTDDLSSEYPSKIYEYIGKGIDGKWFISLEEGGKLYLPFPCDALTRIAPYSADEGQYELSAGWYAVGVDIPAGKYNLTCKTNSNNAGIVWVSDPGDNLDEDYPSVLYEFIGRDSEKTFYVSLEEGAIIYLPCDAVASFGGITFS